jgi:hypothetical protein
MAVGANRRSAPRRSGSSRSDDGGEDEMKEAHEEVGGAE